MSAQVRADLLAISEAIHETLGAVHQLHKGKPSDRHECDQYPCTKLLGVIEAKDRLTAWVHAEIEARPVSSPPGARDGLLPESIWGSEALKLAPDELVLVSHNGRGKVVDAVKVTGLGEPESMEDEIVRRALADLSLMEVRDREKARELLKCWGGRADLTVDAGERILAHYPTRAQRRSAVFDGVPMHGDGQPVHDRGGDD